MRNYDVVVETREPGSIGEFGRTRFNNIRADRDVDAVHIASEKARAAGKETRVAWIIISQEAPS